MSGLKAIRRRISSVKNTKQITRAMKLVSAAKLRRAQDAAISGRAFSDELLNVLRLVARNLPEDFSHPLLERRAEIRRRRVVVVAGERGLCGAYNTNIFKAVQLEQTGKRVGGPAIDTVLFGRRAVSTGRRLAWPVVREFEGLAEDANTWPVNEVAEQLVKDYINGVYDELVVYYTKFVSAMTQTVQCETLLPFQPGDFQSDAESGTGSAGSTDTAMVTKFDPAPEKILTRALPFMLATRLRQAALESKASEHAARMSAMDSATRNADDLISRLKLFYNRARQSAITRELIDIIGGAEAIK